jgi:hypothetical protein
MTTSLPFAFPYPANEVAHALLAPLQAFRFLWKNKLLFWAAIFTHAAAFALYIFAISRWGVPVLEAYFTPYLTHWTTNTTATSVFSGLFLASIYIFAIIFYSIAGISIANTLMSPLFDVIAARSYEHVSGMTIPKLGLSTFAKSLFVEVLKIALIAAIFIGTALSTLLVFLSPLVFVFSVWFYGWQEIDRTLGLLGLSWRKRIWFGVRHFPACVAFGIWFYIPFLSTLCAFVMTSAAAVVAARIQTEKERTEIQEFVNNSEVTAETSFSADDDRR